MINVELAVDDLTNERYWTAQGKDEDFKCSLCGKELREGFVCENNKNLLLCDGCQIDFNMSRCRHNKGEHAHIRFKRLMKGCSYC